MKIDICYNPVMSGFVLKLLAVVIMLVDHLAVVFGRQGIGSPETLNYMRALGRVAFPIFCFLVVEGAIHTKDKLKYFIRLIVFGIISELFYDMTIQGRTYYPYR